MPTFSSISVPEATRIESNLLPKLSKTYSCGSSIKNDFSYQSTIRNCLIDQENKPLSKTFTMGTRISNTQNLPRRGRSSSIDSDFGDYTIHGAISGLIPRNIGSRLQFSKNHINRKSYSYQSTVHQQCNFSSNLSAAATIWATCAKLPSLEGCSPDRKCCIKPFVSSRNQYELAKYKKTLKNNFKK